MVHALAALWCLGLFTLPAIAPAAWDRLVREDFIVEWWTVTLFAAAAWYGLRSAVPQRRVFDILVGLFCVFVAGEEFSWGQRLLGFTPPDAFLEHNKQQELTLHNFTAIVREPRWILMLALAGYGILLPAAARAALGRRLLNAVRATPPPLATVPWFAVSVALLFWYPVSFTGEWIEALTGGLFLYALAPRPRSAMIGAAIALVLAGVLTLVSGAGLAANEEQVACAREETAALLGDLADGGAATPALRSAEGVHKRVYTSVQEGWIDGGALVQFGDAPCPEETRPAQRRRHAIDPWGNAYWVRLEPTADGRLLTVYSFGPNRRRDDGGDDVSAWAVVR